MKNNIENQQKTEHPDQKFRKGKRSEIAERKAIRNCRKESDRKLRKGKRHIEFWAGDYYNDLEKTE